MGKIYLQCYIDFSWFFIWPVLILWGLKVTQEILIHLINMFVGSFSSDSIRGNISRFHFMSQPNWSGHRSCYFRQSRRLSLPISPLARPRSPRCKERERLWQGSKHSLPCCRERKDFVEGARYLDNIGVVAATLAGVEPGLGFRPMLVQPCKSSVVRRLLTMIH